MQENKGHLAHIVKNSKVLDYEYKHEHYQPKNKWCPVLIGHPEFAIKPPSASSSPWVEGQRSWVAIGNL